MRNSTCPLNYCILLFMSAFVISEAVAAQEHRLRLLAYAVAWGGSCEPGSPNIISGSRLFLEVTNTADQPAQTLVPGWPEDYVLEAALDLPSEQPFVSTPGLIERLEPSRFLGQVNRGANEVLRHSPTAFREHENLNAKYFVLTIVPELAGHTLSFRARYEARGLSLVSNSFGPIRIITPCDRSDTARIIATRIYEAWEVGDYHRGVEIADSMLAVGLTDAPGWHWAEGMARGLQLYDKALIYLQRLYEDFGAFTIRLNTADPPRLNRDRPFDAKTNELYEDLRNWLLRLKAENEQLQHE